MQAAHRQIEALLYHYANGIDDGDFAVTASLFKHGVILDGTGKCIARGENEVLAFYQRIIKIYPKTNTPQTQHLVTNLVLHDEKDGMIECTANYTVFQKAVDDQIQTIICGQYRSTFKRHDGIWCFHLHQMQPRMIGDLSRHLKVPLTEIQQDSKN